MYIPQKYLKWMEYYSGTPLVKVLVGMRRVGKSTLLNQFRELRTEVQLHKRVVATRCPSNLCKCIWVTSNLVLQFTGFVVMTLKASAIWKSVRSIILATMEAISTWLGNADRCPIEGESAKQAIGIGVWRASVDGRLLSFIIHKTEKGLQICKLNAKMQT